MDQLASQSILVVEDEILIAMDLEDLLIDAGCREVRLATSVAEGLRVISAGLPDRAVLDVNVGGEMVFPIADALARASVPYVLLTGHSEASLPERLRDCPILAKPFHRETLVSLLAGAHPRADLL